MVIDGKRLQGEKPTDRPFKSNFQQKAFLKRVQWEKGDWLTFKIKFPTKGVFEKGPKEKNWLTDPLNQISNKRRFWKRIQGEKGDWLKRIQGEKLIDWPDAGSVQVCRRVARWCRSRMKSFHSSRILWFYDDGDDDDEEEEEEEEGGRRSTANMFSSSEPFWARRWARGEAGGAQRREAQTWEVKEFQRISKCSRSGGV